MKNIVIAILTSVLLFAASAGTSLYLNQPVNEAEPDTVEDEKLDLPPKDPFPELPVKEKVSQMPVNARPNQDLTIEAVRQMAESAQKRQEQLNQFEQELKSEEQHIQTLMQDLNREKMELNAFSDGVEAKIVALDKKTVQLTDLLARIEKEKKDLKTLQRQTGSESAKDEAIAARVEETKSWLQGVDAETAAKVITGFANDGDMEFAAELLHALEDRQKSKILEALKDHVLFGQLLQAVQIKKKTGKKK